MSMSEVKEFHFFHPKVNVKIDYYFKIILLCQKSIHFVLIMNLNHQSKILFIGQFVKQLFITEICNLFKY